MTENKADYTITTAKKLPPADTLRVFSDPEYKPPTADDVRTLLQYAGITGAEAASITGTGSGRTVRRWVGNERQIPYSAWRLLLLYAGLVTAETQKNADFEKVGEKRFDN